MEETLKQKVLRALKRPLVGDYVFSEVELNELYRELGNILRRLEETKGCSLGKSYDEIVFVALVNACKEWNSDDDTFFGYIFKKFLGSNEFHAKSYKYIQDVIDRVNHYHGVLFLNHFVKKYYVSLSAHAMAPISSMKSFYDLCWRIYSEDLSYEYIEGDSVFNMLAEALSIRFSGKSSDDKYDIDINLGSHVYHFKAWQKGLALYRKDLMASLIQGSIHDISLLYEGIPLNTDKHYASSLVLDWWDKKKTEISPLKKYERQPRVRVLTDYGQIKPRYLIDESSTVIFIDSFRLLSDYDISPTFGIYSKDREVFSAKMPTKGSGLLLATKPFSYNLDDLKCNLEELTLKITQKDKVIFDSKNSMKREFVMFSNGHEITSQTCVPGNYQLFVYDFDVIQQYPDDINRETQNMYTFSAREGDILQSTGRTVFFESEETERKFWVYGSKEKNLIYRENGRDYEVVDGEIYICTTASLDVNSYSVMSAGKCLEFYSFPKTNREDGAFYRISALMLNGIPKTISVVDKASGKIMLSFGVVKYNSPEVTFDKNVYYGNLTSGTATFKSAQYEGSQSFTIDDEEVLISIGNGEIVVNPPVFSWSVDGYEKHHGCMEESIWYKSLTNSSILKTSIPGRLLFSNNSEISSSGKNMFKLGEALYSKADTIKDSIDVLFRIDSADPVIIPIASFVFSEKFTSLPYYVNELKKTIAWEPNGLYIGDKGSIFTMEFIDSDGKLYAECSLDLNGGNIDLSEFRDDYYSIRISKKPSAFQKKGKLFSTRQVCIGDRKALKYRKSTLKFSKIFPSGSNRLSKEIKPFYVDNLRFLARREGFDFYSGSLFVMTAKGKKIYLNRMRNDSGGYDRINPVRLEMKDDRTCWIVFGLGKSIDDFESEFSFDINRGEICNSDNPKNVLGIQFYEFKEVKNNV